MIKIIEKKNCCGCTACANICPHDAIMMLPDALGFNYPSVNMEKCIDCGLCEKVCAFNPQYDRTLNLIEPIAYAVRHKNVNEIETSRSGAAFIAISDVILNRSGVVYGVGYKEHFVVAHKRATTKVERNEFKGSKYTQSELGTIFGMVKKDLKDGKIVLFSGTPCQTAGLNAFVGKRLRENLFLVDIICHGVPSPYIWKDYISFLEKKYHSQIIAANFRDKSTLGWSAHKESFRFQNGRFDLRDNFQYLFFKHVMLRESCGTCHFSNISRPSDITIGDFWGWQKVSPELNCDNKGVSLVFINTEKGKKLFNDASNNLTTMQVKIEDCLQPNLCGPTIISKQRFDFEEDYIKNGFEAVLSKYGNFGFKYLCKNTFMRILNKLNLCLPR